MKKKEKIIEILKRRSSRHFEGDGVYSQIEYLPEISFEDVADAILALPIEVPSDKEINKMAYNACMKPSMPNGEPEPEHRYYDAYMHGVNDMRDEIIKRNQQ